MQLHEQKQVGVCSISTYCRIRFNKCTHAFSQAINVLNTLTFSLRCVLLCVLLLIFSESPLRNVKVLYISDRIY